MNRKSTIATQKAYIRTRHQRTDDWPPRTEDPIEAPRTQGLVGQVVTINKARGFGFLVTSRNGQFATGVQYFFHRGGFARPDEFDTLEPGHYLTFEPRDTAKGLRAEQLARA